MTDQPPAITDIILIDEFERRLLKKWPIVCIGRNVMLIQLGETVEFTKPAANVRIAARRFQVEQSGWHGNKRLTSIPIELECGSQSPLSVSYTRAAALPPGADPNDPENYVPGGLVDFARMTFVVELSPTQKFAVFAFIVTPSVLESAHDILALELVPMQEGGGTGDNSVHGGPPT